MEEVPRRLRADAERNRQRLIAAASELFAERGLEVGVGEIAEAAGVGRGTLFRNFCSKQALIVAVVVERITDSVERARAHLEDPDPAGALFVLIDQTLERQALDRALFDALTDRWLLHPEIRAAHHAMLTVVDEMLARAQRAGGLRTDVSGVDVLLLVKGVCESQRQFPAAPPELFGRQLDLIKAALTRHDALTPLRGRPPSSEDLDRALSPCVASEAVATDAPLVRSSGAG